MITEKRYIYLMGTKTPILIGMMDLNPGDLFSVADSLTDSPYSLGIWMCEDDPVESPGGVCSVMASKA